MSLKHRTYLEFLQRRPDKDEVTEYISGLTELNQKEFNRLILFSYYGLEKIAKSKKLHKIGDMYFTFSGVLATIASLCGAALLNNLYFHLGLYGFIIMFGILNFGCLTYIISYRKKPIYVPQSELWQITMQHYLHWLHRDSDDFIQVLQEFDDQLPQKKPDKFMKIIFKK